MKSNTKESENNLFKKVNQILTQMNINYWVCHGTLLGIVRDNMILPWDHDIDFAVWKDETSVSDIEMIFKQHGFKQEKMFGEMDCLHFISETKQVDISFYERKNNIASIKWVAPSAEFKNKLIFLIARIICDENFIFKNKMSFKIRATVEFVFIKTLLLIKLFLTKKMRNKIYSYSKRYFTYTGYSYPEELMQFKEIDFLAEKVPIPVESEKCLELTYGKDWKTQKKDYIWYEEASNLVDLK